MAKAQGVKPKIIIKGSQEFRHDLFKSDVKNLLKNTSFKPGVVDIVRIEHAHIFHSHDSAGKEQQYTSTVGGHFHKVETSIDDEGNLIAKCGPALRVNIRKSKRGGQKKVVGPVQWANDGEMGDEVIVDDHTHVLGYQSSEFLSQKKMQDIREETRGAVAAMIATSGASRVESAAGAADDAGDGGDGDAD